MDQTKTLFRQVRKWEHHRFKARNGFEPYIKEIRKWGSRGCTALSFPPGPTIHCWAHPGTMSVCWMFIVWQILSLDKIVNKNRHDPHPPWKNRWDQIITNQPKFITTSSATKKRYTIKWEPERKNLMFWGMVREGFPEEVMYELRPEEWVDDNQAKETWKYV